MFEISHESYFAGAHFLRNYNGACENLHGHNWKVRTTVRTEKLNDIGIGIDFKILKRHTKEVTDILDHTCLNDLFTEERGNPTAENIAKWIYEAMEEHISKEEGFARISRVDVWETEGNCASYFCE